MKCPNCGQWNQANFARCFKCGEPLFSEDAVPTHGVTPPAWQQELTIDSQKSHIVVDEDGEVSKAVDSREALAQSMSELKKRKIRGEARQRELRKDAAKRGAAPSNLNITKHTSRQTFFTFDEGDTAGIRRVKSGTTDRAPLPVFDSLDDSGSLEFESRQAAGPYYTRPQDVNYKKIAVHRIGLRRFLRTLLILVVIAAAAFGGVFGYNMYRDWAEAKKQKVMPIITASMQDDLAAHTILIPGEEGAQIYIRELRLTYTVIGGFATVEVPDHTWYDEYQDYLQSTMTVTLTPFQKTASGQQKPMDIITYEIEIPLSRIELLSPDVTRLEISTAMYTIRFRVQENSTVFINDENLTDMVNLEGGDVTYNATVQPIGDNVFTISVRSQHCRENKVNLVLYRAVQEIPLDLASDTHQKSSDKDRKMKITATTLPGAIVNVVSPHSDLDITNIDSTGTFTFYALFDHIGYNIVTITADYPGKQQSVLNYEVYYVPTAAVYTPKAWDIVRDYADLLANNALRSDQTQPYVCIGVIEQIISEKPQMAVMNAGTAEKPVRVLLENNTRNTWVVGERYRIYADAYGMYDDMPRLQARFTYEPY